MVQDRSHNADGPRVLDEVPTPVPACLGRLSQTGRGFSDASGCLRVQLNSDTVCPEVGSDSTGKGLSPTRPPSASKSRHLPRSSPVLLTSWSHDHLLEFDEFAEWFVELGKTCLLTRSPIDFIRVLKGANQWPDGEIHRAGCGGGVQNVHALSEFPPPVHCPRSSLNPVLWEFVETSSHRHNWSTCWLLAVESTPRPSPTPGQRVGLKVPAL